MTTENQQGRNYLSKSLFIRGLQCHKSLYLHKYHPELKDEISEAQEALFQTGFEVGDYAKQLFPGGVEIPYDGLTYAEQVEKTSREVEKGTTTIYEAAFNHDGVFVKVDIFHKGAEGWEVYEVKSSTGVSNVHLNDIAVQYYVVNGSGLHVTGAYLVCVNKHYVREGELQPSKLFTITDVTPVTEEKQVFVEQKILELQTMLDGNMPNVGIGEYCDAPYACDFQGHCWQHIPSESVFELKRKGVNKYDLYRKGIIEMKDIPIEILNWQQRMQVEALLNKSEVTDKNAIASFLKTLFYPIYFLDFETIFTALPPFDGTSPYQQVPFQFSLHMQENEQSPMRHYEFLAEKAVDPRRELMEKLLEYIPENACIVSYTDFETKILRGLAKWFPEYREKIEKMMDNICDLATPFSRMDYYHWQMNGSYSIKKVLPQLVPEMSYDTMDIRDGMMAINAYFRMNASNDPAEIAGIRKALLEYCKLDTIAMVKILEKLKAMCA